MSPRGNYGYVGETTRVDETTSVMMKLQIMLMKLQLYVDPEQVYNNYLKYKLLIYNSIFNFKTLPKENRRDISTEHDIT